MAIYRTGKIGGGGAFPANVFVVLLKPRVNYARGINERPKQRDRIEIRPARIGTIGMIECSSCSYVKYIEQFDHRTVQNIVTVISESIILPFVNKEYK